MLSDLTLPRAAVADPWRFLYALFLIVAASSYAPDVVAAGASLSYAEALRLALAQSGQLVSQRAMVDAAHEMAGPAGELPDPKLRIGVDNVPTDGPDRWTLNRDFMTMTKVGVMQEFPREEKRKLRSQRLERDAARGAVAVESTQLAVQREVAAAWLTRRFAGDTERTIADQIAEAELALATAGAAYRAGKAGQSELIAVQSMLVELRNRATDAAAQSRRATIALARYIGPDAERPLGDAPTWAACRSTGIAFPTSTCSPTCGSRKRRKRSPRPTPISRARRKRPTGALNSPTPCAARPIRTWSR